MIELIVNLPTKEGKRINKYAFITKKQQVRETIFCTECKL